MHNVECEVSDSTEALKHEGFTRIPVIHISPPNVERLLASLNLKGGCEIGWRQMIHNDFLMVAQGVT